MANMEQLILFPADSPANPSVQLDKNEERRMTVTSGRKCLGLLKNLSRLGLLLKMCLTSSIWHSTAQKLTWKPKATPRNRLLFQLVESTRGTSEGDFGLWPTPAVTVTGGPTGLGGGSGNRKKLYKMVGEDVGKKMASGSLNPEWEEWLMGYPIGWTELEDSETP